MLKLNVDTKGVVLALEELHRQLTDVNTMGRAIKMVCDTVWIPNIARRFSKSQAQSGYRMDLDWTMAGTDPDFVKFLSGDINASWAQRTELERRGKYAKMGMTEEVIEAIDSSVPGKLGGTILLVGVGDIEKLNNLWTVGEGSHHLWQLLEFGTGIYGQAKQGIWRRGKQIFIDRDGTKKGVVTWFTYNPGFKGRHAFLDVAGDFYQSEKLSVNLLYQYINSIIRKLSYK